MTQPFFLKMKIKRLTTEAIETKAEERKVNTDIRKLLKKEKDIAAERALIRFNGLRNHRTGIIRSESRAACVAYGFIRGREYQRVEKTTSLNPPVWSRVADLVTKYGPVKDRDRNVRELRVWSKYDPSNNADKIALLSIK